MGSRNLVRRGPVSDATLKLCLSALHFSMSTLPRKTRMFDGVHVVSRLGLLPPAVCSHEREKTQAAKC